MSSGSADAPLDRAYAAGLALLAGERWFEAHEAFETAWRAAAGCERDFFQGLVHVAVAWYQASRGNEVGCERQLAKALRRLGPFAPVHRGLDVAALAAQLAAARGAFPSLPSLELRVADAPAGPGG
ncbi:MAG: DUF309 domain-containing protein [Thermoleophilia bacterium]